jgi:hypothetical protein
MRDFNYNSSSQDGYLNCAFSVYRSLRIDGQRRKMRVLMVLAVLAVLVSGCTSYNSATPRTQSGAGIGAIVGGLGGLIVDRHNPWRGAIIGAAAGAVVGAVVGNIEDTAAQEAARRDTTVSYDRTSDQGWHEQVVATPRGEDGDYKLVDIKYIRDGQVTGEEIKRVPINR